MYVKALTKWIDEGLASAYATRNSARKSSKEHEETGKVGVPLKIMPADCDDFMSLRDYLARESQKLAEPMLEQEASITFNYAYR